MRLRLWLDAFLVVAVIVSAGILPASSNTAAYPDPSPPPIDLGVSAPGLNPITLIAVSTPDAYREPLPDWATGQRVQNATFSINYIPAGSTNALGDYCLAWPSGSQAAFFYAASVWATSLNSAVPIRINACWANLGYGVLGHSATTSLHRDFSGSVPGTWYAAALANSIAGTDLNGADSDMEIAYSGNGIDWYFGTDGNPGSTQYDFVSVVLHEVAHGLGFAGTMRVSALAGGWGGWPSLPPYYPAIYDRFTENGAGTKLIDTSAFPNGSFALGNELTGSNIYFDGSNADAANGGNRPKLYAPSTWKQGSSYSHLDDVFNNTPNALMTWSLDDGEAVHNPGPVTMGILKDVGWTTSLVPIISSLDPSLVVQSSGAFTLKVNGSGFASGSVVRWNGSARTTTYVSSSLLTASIPASDIASAGTAQITVRNSGGEVSAPKALVIVPPGGIRRAYLPWTSKNLTFAAPPTPSIPNGNFESGKVSWTESSSHGWPIIISSGYPGGITPHSGTWLAWLGGDDDDTSYIQQQVSVVSGSAYLAYWHWIASSDSCGYDFARVVVNGTAVNSYNLCSSANTGGWVKKVVNLGAYAGQSVMLKLTVETDSSANSNLFVDDVAWQSSP